MEWESDSEFHKLRADVGVIKTGGSDEGSKHTPANEARSCDEQQTEKAGSVRDEQTIHCRIDKFESRISKYATDLKTADQSLSSSTDKEHMVKVSSQKNKEFIDSLMYVLRCFSFNHEQNSDDLQQYESEIETHSCGR